MLRKLFLRLWPFQIVVSFRRGEMGRGSAGQVEGLEVAAGKVVF